MGVGGDDWGVRGVNGVGGTDGDEKKCISLCAYTVQEVIQL